jgi:hypothetical protein
MTHTHRNLRETMSDQPTVTITVEGVGAVTMIGVGPWKVYEIGHSREIKDSTGQVANPTVLQTFGGRGSNTLKPNRNVVFARPSKADAVVAAANAKLEELTAS